MYVLMRVDAVVPMLLIVAMMLTVTRAFDVVVVVVVAVVVAVRQCIERRLRWRAAHRRPARDSLSR